LTALDLGAAQLSGLNLPPGTDMSRAVFRDRSAQLARADLTRARLDGVKLAGADLSRAVLADASFVGADLSGTIAELADFRRAHLDGANLAGAQWNSVDLQEASLVDTDFRGARLDNANLRGANLRGALFDNANLRGAYLRDTQLDDGQLQTADIGGAALDIGSPPAADITATQPSESQAMTTDASQEETARRVVLWAKRLTQTVGVASAIGIVVALWRYGTLSDAWLAKLTVFAAVATLPQFAIDRVAQAAESIAEDQLPKRLVKRGFENLGAWVGVIERPLLLGALVGGFPEFLAGWYVLKGIAGYRLGFDQKQLAERRAFQLFLINNGLSFAGVALGWLIWRLLGFPTLHH
jgi:hypothetical protein